MTPTENIRLECLQLASSHLCNEPHNVQTLLEWAQKFYDFATSETTVATTTHEQAEKPTGAVSREWLYDKLTEMLHETETNRAAAATLMTRNLADGQCDALQWVIELINPKKQ